ncbi:MAG: (2Fe-2S) ferredoxin domain-containing protein [Scytonema sp. PMC 1069.18]|nr:(2Fe-2S) ferredoxin domain-containing protein [Scytonema sp. PMC 1069.18]MEC4886428.1 (2Fe-2S) ferredoxin domain-containing protein [Scytonema sp. PMC 1070.18]
MGKSYAKEVSEFCLEGQLLEFVIKDGYKLKGLILKTSEGECYIKLGKHLRAAFNLHLQPGTWLQVVGEKKHDLETGEVKLKAYGVMTARPRTNEEMGRWGDKAKQATLSPRQSINPPINSANTKKSTILVCQKSDCMKRGGREVCQAMEAALSDRGLESQVTIRGTGCMKNCKAGPNVVIDKTRYSRISASQVPALINKHFCSNIEDNNKDDGTDEKVPVAS